MNSTFNLKYEQMRQGNPASPGNASDHKSEADGNSYPQEGHVRNICFVFQDGKRIFLNYSYLVAGEYSPNENIIILSFTTHFVTLKGISLETIYYEIMQQLIKQVICTDARYNATVNNEQSVINEITVVANS